MRRSLVAGNWKMHGSRDGADALLQALIEGLGGYGRADVMVCPPAVYLQAAEQRLEGSPVALGAQNCSDETQGAFTGEIAATMLAEFSVRYVLVGHSERRALYAEDDALVARKFRAAKDAGLVPVLCVGETLAQRDAGDAERVVAAQLEAVLQLCSIDDFAGAVVAYEPVWAIGTGRTASPEQAQQMHQHIRARLAAHDGEVAGRTRILYGGSVNAGNAAELFAQPDIDGGLVGGASLQADDFIAICNSVS